MTRDEMLDEILNARNLLYGYWDNEEVHPDVLLKAWQGLDKVLDVLGEGDE